MGLMFVGGLLFTNSLQAQIEQGSVLVEPYYGLAATGKAVVAALASTGTTSSTTNLGPVGLRFTYMISEKVGLGIDGNYQNQGVEFTDGTYNYSLSRSVIRVMLNSHFIFLNEESFQLYGNVGAGYRTSSWTYTSDDPTYTGDSISGLIPVAIKLGFGGRYMFTKNIGLHADLNLGGGAYANGGLSFAF